MCRGVCCSNKDIFEDDLDIHLATEESLGETDDTYSDEQLQHEVEDTMQMVFGEGAVYTDDSEDEDIEEYTCIYVHIQCIYPLFLCSLFWYLFM